MLLSTACLENSYCRRRTLSRMASSEIIPHDRRPTPQCQPEPTYPLQSRRVRRWVSSAETGSVPPGQRTMDKETRNDPSSSRLSSSCPWSVVPDEGLGTRRLRTWNRLVSSFRPQSGLSLVGGRRRTKDTQTRGQSVHTVSTNVRSARVKSTNPRNRRARVSPTEMAV